MEVYAMKVTLLGTSPPVWRRVLVDRDMTLRDLHLTLQAVMGWENSHLHQFVLPRRWNRNPQRDFCTKIVNESRTRVGDVIGTAGERLLYEYDLGDGWRHELRLEDVLLGDESFQPMCVAGERCCPPEDCGGPQGFAAMLAALRNASDSSHEEVCEWLGDFDPASFSADEITRRLRRRRKH